MYVTRPLSLYKRDPSALYLPPPEGPNSGILVIQDEDPTCFFGLLPSSRVKGLPFPQNKNLKVRYVSGGGEHQHVHINRVVFIPALNQPLSSNQYYVVERQRRGKGKAYVNSTEEDMTTCCFFCNCITDLEPEDLNPNDLHQKFEIRKRDWGGYVANSVAPDGIPPRFLRRKGWTVQTSSSLDFELGEAPGLNTNLRACLPDFNFPLSQKTSDPVVVGKWCSPFMFIKEPSLKEQVKYSRYYQITLEQRWEQIFVGQGEHILIDTEIEKEVVAIYGRTAEPLKEHNNAIDGTMWFRSLYNEVNVGLSLAVVERMKWEEERAGWVNGSEGKFKLRREETGQGRRIGCYVLVERFVVKRMDDTLVLTYDFKHTHQVRSKSE